MMSTCITGYSIIMDESLASKQDNDTFTQLIAPKFMIAASDRFHSVIHLLVIE